MRKTTQVALFLVCLNAAAGFLTASGVGGDLGVGPQVGGGETIEQANSTAAGYSPGGGSQSQATGIIGAVTRAASVLIDVIAIATVGGPQMLLNLGWPPFLVSFLFAPVYIVAGLDIASFAAGRRT